ncbi:MFS transporter [Desulfovibrio gilichinskyi]|uniref:MFS transporter n=1 Tax=Desulfovibrio gilichinskyi TaxID=1519643 RepID=UPI0010FA6277|nr:MFS transporter [Desulfovibrio gilichinskyi]
MLAAPFAGRIADQKGPELVNRLGAGLTAVSFALMFIMPALSPQLQLCMLGIAAVGFDLGAQTSLIAHQTIIYALDPDARSRLNAVLFVGMFTGMSLGSALGSALQGHWGWSAVTVLARSAAFNVKRQQSCRTCLQERRGKKKYFLSSFIFLVYKIIIDLIT